MSLMGIDVGTSGCKVLVISMEGKILCESQASYIVHSKVKGQYELESNGSMGKS